MATTTYARTQGGNFAFEIVVSDKPIGTLFAPPVAALFEVVPNGTLQGATRSGGIWTNPGVTVPPPPPPPSPLTVFEISPGQLRNRMPWQSEAWFEANDRKADDDDTKNRFAAVIWSRIKDARTINVLAQNVLALGAAIVAQNIPELDEVAMGVCLTPSQLPGETRDGLIG